jgi:hypothetical protein
VGRVASIAVAVAVLGVFLTWTSAPSASLDGTQGPNNGWLVVIVGVFALGSIRLMARGSMVGMVGVFGASIVLFWTAAENWLDNRQVFGGTAGYGLVIVVAASAILAATSVTTAVGRARRGQRA